MVNDMNDGDVKEIRQHFTKCLIEKINQFQYVAERFEQYKIKLKTWCITLFMVSAGFCLKEDFKNFTWLLPFAPVILFWFIHSYREYLDGHYYEFFPGAGYNIWNVLSEIYEYSLDDLNKIAKETMVFHVTWPDQSKWKIKRGLKKIIYHIPKKAVSFENVFFFGVMFVVWTIVLFINFILKP